MPDTTSFLIHVLKAQWVILALGSGTILLFLAILTYLAIWRPREKVKARRTEAETGWGHALRHIPFILIVTYAGMILFAVSFSL
mgnify:CR=1 FL=1